jgi:hypothetical protein
MQIISIQVTDAKFNALSRVANKDGISVTELVQAQMNYYTDVVLRNEIDSAAIELPLEKQEELKVLLVETKAQFVETALFEKAAAENPK